MNQFIVPAIGIIAVLALLIATLRRSAPSEWRLSDFASRGTVANLETQVRSLRNEVTSAQRWLGERESDIRLLFHKVARRYSLIRALYAHLGIGYTRTSDDTVTLHKGDGSPLDSFGDAVRANVRGARKPLAKRIRKPAKRKAVARKRSR